MFTFTQYVEKAKETQGLKTTNQLASILKINSSAIANFTSERSYPSQETVLKLAKLAGIKPEKALIDFNLWKTKDKPDAHRIWQKMSKMIGCLLLANILYCANSNDKLPSMEKSTINESSNVIYYV